MKQIPVTESWHIGVDGKPDSHHISVEPIMTRPIDETWSTDDDCEHIDRAAPASR